MAGRKGKPTRDGQIRILVDRSRDPQALEHLVGLRPVDRYHTTDNLAPLRRSCLRDHDVVAIGGEAPDVYSRGEVAALVDFVRGGGGLILAGSTGAFARYAGGVPDEMAVGAIARRFGIEFLSPDAAAGKPKPDIHMIRGYSAGDVRCHKLLTARRLHPRDPYAQRWNPVATDRKATVLMNHRRTGEAAALMVSFGRGRVVAVGSAEFLHACGLLAGAVIELAAGGRPGAGRTSKPQFEILPEYRSRRVGRLRIRYPAFLAARAADFLRIARKVLPVLQALLETKPAKTPEPPRPAQAIDVELTASATSGMMWSRFGDRAIRIGLGAADGEVAFALAAMAGDHFARSMPGGAILVPTVLGWNALGSFLGLAAMRAAGFAERAEALGRQLDAQSRKLSAGRDLGWAYSEDGPRPGLWLWRELAGEFGDDILARFVKAVPTKPDWSAAPEVYYTPLDKTIYLLSRAVRRDLFGWFAQRGMTVRPMPVAALGSKRFKQSVARMLRSVVADAAQPASERIDAAEALAQIHAGRKRPLAHAARQCRAASPAVRLVGAIRLSRTRDGRAAEALWSVARNRNDTSLAAAAAMLLVEHGEKPAGDVLARLAEEADVRFQLEAGHHLRRIGHPAAERFSPEGIRRAAGRSATGMLVRHHGSAEYYSCANGEPVANIFGGDHVAYMAGATPVSMFYLQWVHTAPKFRRKGMSRRTLAACLDDHRARRCSCFALHTGTRFNAHAMYRSFGFVDATVYQDVRCELPAAIAPVRAAGVRVRPYRPGDEAAMAALFDACYEGKWAYAPIRPQRLPPNRVAVVAHRGRKMVAFVHAVHMERRAEIIQLAVADHKDAKVRRAVTAAVVARLHRDLVRRGVERVTLSRGQNSIADLLGALGYSVRPGGGVLMFALRDLPQLLEELRPLLSRRLEKAGWTGTISLLSPTHRAALFIDGPRVEVLRRPPARADIALSGSDRTITRIAGGIATPFEEYLQLDLQITPMLNDRTRELLETLWPKVQEHYWF